MEIQRRSQKEIGTEAIKRLSYYFMRAYTSDTGLLQKPKNK